MDKIKKIIIILLIAIISIIIILVLLLRHQNKDTDINNKASEESAQEILDEENIIHKIDTDRQYFDVKDCLEKYKEYAMIVYNMKGLNEYQQQTSISKLKSLIPEFVTTELGINDGNIAEMLGWPDCIMIINNIYVSRQTINKKAYIEKTNINAYIVEGVLINPNNAQNKKEYKLIVILDEINDRFLIIPQQYIENKKINIEEGQSLKIYQDEVIDDYTYNSYTYEERTEMDMAKEYFNLTKYYSLYDTDYLYNKMSEEYRTKRFGNIENYRKYVKDNSQELQNSTIKQYLVNNSGEITQYVVKDQYENLYIFDTKSVLNYTVKLDTYTIYTEKFKTTYENAKNEDRVQMNIDKFFQMINRQDYRTSYSVLAQSFKNNKIKTQEDFEKIAKNYFFTYNKIEYVDYKDLGSNTYSFSIKLTDLTGQKNEERNMTIIMQLKEGTDFVMSFSFN